MYSSEVEVLDKVNPADLQLETGSLALPASFLELFRPLETLGEGASSVVLRAIQIELSRSVVVKVLRIEKLNRGVFRTRFEREAKLLAGLNHPHILTLLDFGILPEVAYMVYPDDRGVSLRRLLQSGKKLSTEEALKLLRELLSGLVELHGKGIVHRDIKPGNLLLKEDGRWSLFDLGLAKFDHGDNGLTATGEVVGTPLYMPPEQILGESPDPRDDLYSVGVMMREILTQENVFRSESIHQTMQRHMEFHPPPLAQAKPEIPPPLARLIDQCLEKKRSCRPDSARSALDRLERATARSPKPARNPPRLPRASPRSLGLGAGALLTLVSILWMSGSPPATGVPDLSAPAPLDPLASPPEVASRPSPEDLWIPRLKTEFEKLAELLPRDPQKWGTASTQLAELRDLNAWISQGGELRLFSAPARSQLRDLGSQYRAMGLPDPFELFLTARPSLEPVAPIGLLPDPRGFPTEFRQPQTGWTGTAFAAFHRSVRRLQARENDVELVIQGREPRQPIPALLRQHIQDYVLLLEQSKSSVLNRSVLFLWNRSPQTRVGLGEWLREDTLDVQRMVFACTRALDQEPESAAFLALLGGTWISHVKTFTWSPEFLTNPEFTFAWKPQTPDGWYFLGSLLILNRRREIETYRDQRAGIEEVVDAFVRGTSFEGDRATQLLRFRFMFLSLQGACLDSRRPDLLVDLLEKTEVRLRMQSFSVQREFLEYCHRGLSPHRAEPRAPVVQEAFQRFQTILEGFSPGLREGLDL